MTHNLNTKRRPARRFIFLSPLITVLSVVAIILLVAIFLLGTLVARQNQVTASVFGLNETDTARPFVQLQRETLRMLDVLSRPLETLNLDDVDLQFSLLKSRILVMSRPALVESYPSEIKESVDSVLNSWMSIELNLTTFLEDSSNDELRLLTIDQLRSFEVLVNQTEIGYQFSRALGIRQLSNNNDVLIRALSITSGVFLAFFVLAVYSIVRFLNQRHLAEEEAQLAMAAEAAALQSSQFKDQFMATMSHELRTPLNAIIGFLGVLKMTGGLTEQHIRMVDRSRANAERLLNLINDILDLSKIEAGRVELVESKVVIRRLINRLTAQMEILAQQKQLQFKVEIDDALPECIRVDEDALTKIVTNLLSNAIKFTEKGEVKLSLNTNGELIRLSVQDTGIGIPPHLHETIFDSFRQADASVTRKYGGSGLGLAIVQRLVIAMRGKIHLKSSEGVGSQFTVEFPLVNCEPIN
ncbi:MAG: sensor histidine kinase [Phototrophicaceae bacterium]